MAEIAKCDDATEQEIKWQLLYYEKWEEFPNRHLQAALEKLLEDPSLGNVNNLITDHNGYEQMVQQAGKQAADKAMIRGLNRMVAEEIVKASVGGAKLAGGRRAAVVVVEETANLAASRGASMAMNGVKVIGSLPVGITAAAGELVGDGIAYLAGVENYHGKNALGAGGSMAGGAIAGAVVGGPVGAAAGAAVGAVSWGVGQGIKALTHLGKGPKDNWCYIQIGDIRNSKLCVGTYAGNDTMYWKTYWNEYKKSNSKWVMSAGQKPNQAFQLCIWEGSRVIQHFNIVHYRDTFGIIKRNGKFRVVHCKGLYHESGAGKVDCFEK